MSNLTPDFRDYIRYKLMHFNSDAAYEFINRLEDPCNNSDPMSAGLTAYLEKLVNDRSGSLAFKKIIEAYANTERPRMNRSLLRLFDKFIDPRFQLEFRRRMDVECAPPTYTILSSQSFNLSGITIGYVNGDATYAFSEVRTLSEQLQLTMPFSGTSYFASNYTFWITILEGADQPNWEWNPDPIGDPSQRIPVSWTEMGTVSETFCFEKTYTVPDAAVWFPYYFNGINGNSEYASFTPYDQPTLQDNSSIAIVMTFGTAATIDISVAGNDVTVFASGIPVNQLGIASADSVNPDQLDNFDLIDCP